MKANPLRPMKSTFAIYLAAALAEIAGSFAFWAWQRLDKSILWLIPGALSLLLFAYLLTKLDVGFAGRTYAAYGGVYIVSSVMWLWVVESTRPDHWDISGSILCLAGAAVIFFGPRGVA